MIVSGNDSVSTDLKINPHPLYSTDIDYDNYNSVMTEMESKLTRMHNMTNSVFEKKNQIKALLVELGNDDKFKKLKTEGKKLLAKMEAWDDEMVQRKSLAYDDVENFPNKFTANYLYLINQTESDIPVVNNGSLERKAELDAQWKKLRITGNRLLNTDVPAFNQLLWKNGIGGIWKN